MGQVSFWPGSDPGRREGLTFLSVMEGTGDPPQGRETDVPRGQPGLCGGFAPHSTFSDLINHVEVPFP